MNPLRRIPARGPRLGAALLLVGLAAASGPTGAAAQLAGSVTDATGAPLEGVTVEAWGEALRLAIRVTDIGGNFFFPEAVASRTTAVYAHRIGYRGVRRSVAPGAASPIVIRLDPEAIPLPAVGVVAPRELCPRAEDPGARALWESARTRYLGGLDSMGVATYLAAARDALPRDRLPGPPPEGAALDQRGSSFLLRVSWKRRIEREGYAYPVRRPTRGGAQDSWVYAPLEADLAPHFADPLFGRVHTFSFLDGSGEGPPAGREAPEGWRIVFCPREPERPSIQGTLQLAADTALSAVRWSFRTPEPQEEAGGQALFPPVTPDGSRYLLPSEGITWRRSEGEEFQRSYERFEGWIVAPGDSVPFLPSRRPVSGKGRPDADSPAGQGPGREVSGARGSRPRPGAPPAGARHRTPGSAGTR